MMSLYEPEVPAHLTDCHFKIREPAIPDHDFERRLGHWIETAMFHQNEELYQRRPLSVDTLERGSKDEAVKVVFIRFRLSASAAKAGRVLDTVIGHLCLSMTDPRRNNHMKDLSRRGLFGITPIHPSARLPFRDAIARRTYQKGVSYLQEIEKESQNYSPWWQIAAHFAVVAGISIYSVKYALDYSTKLEKGQETLSWAKKMLQLYGPAGVEAAASFLTGLVTTQPNAAEREEQERSYHECLAALQGKIEAVVGEMRTLSNIRKPTSAVIKRHNERVLDLCYEALESFAMCMLSQKTVMLAYIEGRKHATKNICHSAGTSVGMLVNTLVMANKTMAVPLSQMTTRQLFQKGLSYIGIVRAPTASAFHPVTIGISAVVTAYGVFQLWTSRQEKRELETKIQGLREAAELMSNAWTVTDETALFLRWTYCLDSREHQRDLAFLRDATCDGVVDRWEKMMQGAQQQAHGTGDAGTNTARQKSKSTAKAFTRWASGRSQRPQARNGESSRGSTQQQAMATYILTFVGHQADELDLFLRRSRGQPRDDDDESSAGGSDAS